MKRKIEIVEVYYFAKSNSPKKVTDKIRFTDEYPCQLVNHLKNEKGKDIWICGGASIISQLMKENLIDQYYINVIPTILGNGIRLFDTSDKELKLKLIKTINYNGITDLVYESVITFIVYALWLLK